MHRATKYIFLNFCTSLIGLFAGFGTLYILIDYSLNIKQFINNSSSFGGMLLYFICCYLMRFDFFLIISLLFATLFTITTLKKRYELLAFQAGGISLKRLFSPIVNTSLVCSFLMLFFYQYLYPSVVSVVDNFQQTILKKGAIVFTSPQARSLQLEDGTTLLFTHADTTSGRLQHTYILPSLDDCWYCEEYDPESRVGYEVSHMIHLKEGFELILDRQPLYDFSTQFPSFSPVSWSKRYHKGLPLFEIFKKMKYAKHANVRQTHESNFIFKLSISFLGFLILPIIIGFLKGFSRKDNIGILFATTFAGFICLYMAMISLKILGEENFMSSRLSFSLLLGCITTFSLRSYAKL